MSSRLATVIEQAAIERGWSMREVARRAGLPPATVQKIAAASSTTIPRRETLEALAVGLSVPVSILLDAAAEDSGFKVDRDATDPDIQVVLHAMQELPRERREELAALARAMLHTQRDSPDPGV